ncbi:hypothetical protein MHBO_001018 [Bonamia ostreae]|uniref:dTMP kinase n=1 Tax=Bonamia ostreae TaxID=126728 RepID=A0ABV2AI88_9EUKA
MSINNNIDRRGTLIVFEGLDCSGKSTQVNLLAKFFKENSIPFETMSCPQRDTPVGKLIDSYLIKSTALSDETIHLLFSANRWELNSDMLEKMENGVHILMDRYYYSGIAYSMAKGISKKWCAMPDFGLIAPDITFFLDAPLEISGKRGHYGNEIYEKKEFQKKVRKAYSEMEAHFNMIDAAKDIFEVQKEIRKIVIETIAEREYSKIERFDKI